LGGKKKYQANTSKTWIKILTSSTVYSEQT
jgi:hypothetical protein